MQRHFMLERTALVGLLALGLGGCGIFGDGGEEELTGDALVQHNIEEYESLQAELEKNRTKAMGKSATEAAAVGNRLFWLTFPTSDASLHSLDTASGAQVDYTFGVGDANTWNWRASDAIVVTASQGGGIQYNAYDINEPGKLLGTLDMPSPGGGIRWYAYAPDGHQVYILESGTPNMLLRWTVGAAQPEPLFSLEEAGMSVGEFWDFGVEGNTAILIESGRIWSLDIAARKATWLENETQATAAQWDAKGVFYLAATGPFLYANDTRTNRDLEAEIAASGYELNGTYNRIHEYSEGGARNGDDVAYIGRSGLFLFDLATGKTRPALLDARDNSIVYRNPVLLENGKLFVQGLVSTTGATGAEGGWYEVDY
ncbi:hypothetical protein [Polyangium sp. y55x31]|uniref:hypothetical protein n=1 Tax=Polyangium sp. y55x31 TaxID=3042688 RepID=UPI00248231AE|nr:hypothetical protein [Polyangium sp. y55x31]MDI1479842.1 hypothetical protein [Polyangium sp. y55x31]